VYLCRGSLQAAVDTDEELQEELRSGMLHGPACTPQLAGQTLPPAQAVGAPRDQTRWACPGSPLCREGLVVLVRRAGKRRFSQRFEESIVAMIREAGGAGAAEGARSKTAHPAFDKDVSFETIACRQALRLAVYDADAGHSPVSVLALFAAARGVIAPHGAGLANLVAARPGLSVLEFHPAQPQHAASGIPGLNLCMLHLSRALGLTYTGVLMWPVGGGADAASSEPMGTGTSWAGDVSAVSSWLDALRPAACR
jgi:hypothetical protein